MRGAGGHTGEWGDRQENGGTYKRVGGIQERGDVQESEETHRRVGEHIGKWENIQESGGHNL